MHYDEHRTTKQAEFLHALPSDDDRTTKDAGSHHALPDAKDGTSKEDHCFHCPMFRAKDAGS